MKCVAKTITYAVAELDSKPEKKKPRFKKDWWPFGKKKKTDPSDIGIEMVPIDHGKWVKDEKDRIKAAEDVRYRSNGPCLPGVP